VSVTIRHAKIEDAHVIANAEREIAQTPGFLCSLPSELTDDVIAHTISTFLQEKTGIYLVAEHENSIVGHAYLKPLSLQSLCHVAQLNIVVHHAWQKKGVGAQLLKTLIEQATASSSIEKIELNVRASNTPAIALYKKMGFQEEGRLKNRVKIQDRYIDDILMALDLTNTSSIETAPLIDAFFNIAPATTDELAKLDQAITNFNIKTAAIQPLAETHRLDFSVKNQSGEFLGGIQANLANWGILYIELLFVFEQYRHHGIASLLLKHVERIACSHKCRIAHLNTFDFQAKDFYLKHGFSIFGTLDNVPEGHRRYYMKKNL